MGKNLINLGGQNSFILDIHLFATKNLEPQHFKARNQNSLVENNTVGIGNLFYRLIHHKSWFDFIQMLHGMLRVNQSNNSIQFQITQNQFIATECFYNKSWLSKAYKKIPGIKEQLSVPALDGVSNLPSFTSLFFS